MLYLLTCADLAAVGPGVLNAWKLDLITQLYLRAKGYLSSDRSATGQAAFFAKDRRAVQKYFVQQADASWWNQHADSLPTSYLTSGPAKAVAGKLARLAQLAHDEVATWSDFLPDSNAIEFTVGAPEQITPGSFHKLTGALTSKGLQILSAEIHTLGDKLILDRFHVLDPDHAGEPPSERLDEVEEALVAALTKQDYRAPSFRRVWGDGSSTANLAPLPTRIQIDNNTSDRYTILDIFAHDSMGLLYCISRAIFELGLSVHVAKIGTYLDQVVDVFYVTDGDNRKLDREDRLEEIRQRLLAAIEQHSEPRS